MSRELRNQRLNSTFCKVLLAASVLASCAPSTATAGTILPVPATASLQAPVLASPGDSIVINQSANDTLRWNSDSGAAWYTLQVSTTRNFAPQNTIVVDTSVKVDSFVVVGLGPSIYYWRVFSADSTDTSAWSAVNVFDNGVPPPPSPVGPPTQSSDRPSPVELSWSSSFSETSHVQLAIYRGDFAFSSADIIIDTMVTSDSLVVSGLSMGQTYYWHVSAQNSNGSSSWSSVQTFSTSYPPSVSILQPSYGADVQPSGISCSWLDGVGIVNYEFQLSTDPYFNGTPVVDTLVTGTSVNLKTLARGETYYWRVRGESNVGGYWGSWSSSTFYTVPSSPVLVAPVDSSQVRPVNSVLKWNDITGGIFYEVQIARDSNFTSVIIDTTSPSVTDSLVIDSLSADSVYFWHVRGGSNTNGWGAYSTTRFFSTGSYPPPAPELIDPADSAAVSPLAILFSWNGAVGSEYFLLELSEDSTFARLQLNDSDVVGDSLLVDSLDTGRTYFWRVKSGSTKTGFGQFSTVGRFSTTPYLLATPIPTSPADSSGNVTTNPILRWVPVQHAAFYQTQVSTSPLFDTLIVNDTSVVADSVSVGPLVRSLKYFWRVRGGISGERWGSYSATWSFTAEPWTQPGTVVVDTTMSFPKYSDVSRFKTTDYRLFGLPGADNVPIQNVLGGISGKDWEAFLDNGDTSNYFIRYDGSNSFDFGGGRAFWLVHNGPLKIDTTFISEGVDSMGHVRIAIHAGWNIITDPFNIAVPWDSVKALNGNLADPIWGYGGSFSIANSLLPLEGFYFFNADSLKSLLVPYIEPMASNSPALRMNRISSVGGSWAIHVKLESEGITDSSVWFGVSNLARSGMNNLDVRKPAALGFEPSIYFYHPDWDKHNSSFADEIHPLFSDSSTWNLTVNAPAGKAAILTFTGVESVPQSLRVYLHDPETGEWVDVSQTSAFDFVPQSGTTSITILLANSKVAESTIRSQSASSFELNNNYPNPFNPTTIISYQLPARTSVALTVYDILGQQVTVLVDGVQGPGTHDVVFNGSRFASGVYFYRLVAGDHVATRKMVLVK